MWGCIKHHVRLVQKKPIICLLSHTFWNCLSACTHEKRTHVCLYLLKFCRSTWICLSPYSVYFKTCVSVAIIHEMIPICWTVFLASDEPSTDCDGGGVKARTRTKQSNMLRWKCSFYWKGGAWAAPFISGTHTAKQQHCAGTSVAVCQEHIILIRTYNQGHYVLYNS